MLRYITFGESHGSFVGIVVEGLPPGLDASEAALRADLLRRAGGRALTTARREADVPQFLGGVYEGKTTGEPVCIVFANGDAHSADYDALRDTPRPGHADYTARVKSKGHSDPRGGGHHSGRLTAPLVAAGTLAKQALAARGVQVAAALDTVGGVPADEAESLLRAAATEGDSVGGTVRCTVTGLPAGIGGSEYDETLEGAIARHVFAIPAVKSVSFGDGEALASMRGSDANDAFALRGGAVVTETNHCGGILGGISNGMPLVFTAAFKPTPSIAQPQRTLDLREGAEKEIVIHGRHDPCVALRAVPAVEAACALAILEIWEETT